MAEWHGKWYKSEKVFRSAATAANLSASEAGASMVKSYVAAFEGWVARVTLPRHRHDDCRTRILGIDDESYLHARAAWPKPGGLCPGTK